MQVTPHVHALKIPFRLQAGAGRMLERFVYAYIVLGKRVGLIDCGVAGSAAALIEEVRQAGREPREIDTVFLTHAHPDHMGGLLELKRATGCRVAAHSADAPWVQDVEKQNRERRILNFAELVEGETTVDILLRDGERIDLGDGCTLEVRHTPGHSAGHLCFLYPGEGVLFSGDAVPFTGAVPIYDDPVATLDSLRTLQGMQGVEVLLSSWDEPRRGEQIVRLLREAPEYVRTIHRLVTAELEGSPEIGAEELAARVLPHLGLAQAAGVPIVVRTFQGHLDAREARLG